MTIKREEAEAIIRAHDKTRFKTEDWENFFAIRDNPPEPSERMKKAAQTYKRIITDNR
jgi:uncharacterized protein (DUF1778 family)